MAKKIVTIAGIKYEIDTEDSSYKRRLTPEFTTKEAIKQSIGKAETFLKYLTPGLNTVAFAKDADRSANEAYQHYKNGEYRQAAADAAYTVGNVLSGAASLAPFASAVLKPRPVKISTASEPTINSLTAKSSNELVDMARAGNPEAQKLLQQYGLQWEQKPIYRYIGESEIDELLYNEGRIAGRTSAGVDVTTSTTPSTGMSTQYRVKFRPTHDFSKQGSRAVIKNQALGDGYIRGGYDISDVAAIETIDPTTGQYKLYWQPEFKNGGIVNYFDYFR